jgi:hypothetical protein
MGGNRTFLLQEQIAEEYTTKKHGPSSIWNSFLARSGSIAYLPIIIVTVLMFSGASWQMLWLTTDAARYQCYALTFWLGSSAVKLLPASQCQFLHFTVAQPPFHMLPLEYPPFTLIPFSLALLAPVQYYQLAFALWMALASVLIYWLLLRYGPRGGALTFALYALIGAWATAEGRYDLLPAACTLICVIAAERKRWTLAYIALAFGVLLKLYPLLLFPALFIAEQQDVQCLSVPRQSATLREIPAALWQTLRGLRQWRWKNSLIFFGSLLLVTGFFAMLNFQEAVLSQLSYFMQRPIQIEATSSTFLWLAHSFGLPIRVVSSYGSINMLSAFNGVVSLIGEGAFVLCYAFILFMQWRKKFDLTQASITLLLVFIATGKVFSPQYLIWVMPLLAYSNSLEGFWLLCWGTLSLLTTYIYAYLYSRTANSLLLPYIPGFIQTVAVRDGLFVLATLAYLFNWFHARKRKPLPVKIIKEENQSLYAQ